MGGGVSVSTNFSEIGIINYKNLVQLVYWVRFSAGTGDGAFLYVGQMDPGAHPPSCPVVTGGSFLRGKVTVT
jgi:hypothetical protein